MSIEFMIKFAEEINQLLVSNSTLLEETGGDSLSVKNIELRENLINQLTAIAAALPVIISKIGSTLLHAKEIHARELSTVSSLLNKLKKKEEEKSNVDATPWTTVVRNKKQDKPAPMSRLGLTPRSYAVAPTVSLPKNENPSTIVPKQAKIKFTEALSLSAISVPTFDYVKQDGELYYVESADHFAFKISGQLLHGNIGVIYTDEKNPEKIKDCKFADSCMKRDKCDYYHDPTHFGGSKDHRNFIASAWLYAPPNSHYKNRPRSRRFGSREYLDTDIVGLQEEEITRFHDQTMHDLLCSMLLNQSYTPS